MQMGQQASVKDGHVNEQHAIMINLTPGMGCCVTG